MSRFSVIVPLIGKDHLFEDTLAAVLRYRPSDCQVIVVHDGNYDDPYGLDGEVKFVTSDDQSLISYINVGLCYVAGEFTMFVRPGVEIDENWNERVECAFADSDVGMVTPIIVSRDRPNRILAAGVAADSSWTRSIVGRGQRTSKRKTQQLKPQGPTSWISIYRTSVLKLLAPLDEQLADHCVDQDIAFSFGKLGLANVLLPEVVGYVDGDPGIIEESRLPHGLAAQRLIQRFDQSNIASMLKHCVSDLLKAPLARWRLAHLLQRFSRNRLKSVDASYALKLKKLRLAQSWKADSTPVASESTVQGYRRAA